MQKEQTTDFEIISVKPADPGGTHNYLARVSFAFTPSRFMPLIVKHDAKKGSEWRKYIDAEIHGAATVQVRNAFLRCSQKGEPFVQVSTLDLPWDFAKQVAEAAMARMGDEKEAGDAD